MAKVHANAQRTYFTSMLWKRCNECKAWSFAEAILNTHTGIDVSLTRTEDRHVSLIEVQPVFQ